jgi:hypothetical protein
VREGPENKMGEAGSLAQKGHRGVPRGKMRGIPPKADHNKSAADLYWQNQGGAKNHSGLQVTGGIPAEKPCARSNPDDLVNERGTIFSFAPAQQ